MAVALREHPRDISTSIVHLRRAQNGLDVDIGHRRSDLADIKNSRQHEASSWLRVVAAQ
ncbi:MAG: hypothetical protein M3N82_02925 [Pseudomonadota bacterium]|nr:hypothetical protein [Pseudomonadota bacterium]